MITNNINSITSIVDSRLSVSASEVEAWKTDHDQAMRVFDCEDLVARVVDLYSVIDRLNRSFVDDVVAGLIDYDEAQDDLIKDLCGRWITLAVDVRDGFSIGWFKRQGYTIEKEAELAKFIECAQVSQSHNFDDYAKSLISKMTIPMDLVEKFQTPMHLWPE